MQENYQKRYLSLESQNQDILWRICNNLDFENIQVLLLTSKEMRKKIIEDNVFWESQFKQYFPHLVPQSKPKFWFLVFKSIYISEYYLSGPHSKTNQKRAALFSAAKSGNKDKFKTVFRGMSVKEASELLDNHNYSCFDWLYQKNDQNLLDEIFLEKTVSADKDALFHLAILCNQPGYLETNASQFAYTKEHLSSAARLGSLDIIKIPLEKCSFVGVDILTAFSVKKEALLTAFKDAALCGHTDVAEFLHEKIIERGIAINGDDYKNAMHNALQGAMFNRHKITFKAIVEISKRVEFDFFNHRKSYHIEIDDYVFQPSSLTVIDVAVYQNDGFYLDLLVGSDANLAKFNCNPISVISAISNNCYEKLQRLLKKGIAFNFENVFVYSTTSSIPNDGIKGKDYIKLALKKTSDPRINLLVQLTLYKDKIKNEARTLWSIILQWLGISRPQDKEQKSLASQALFDVMVGNTTVGEFDKLSPLQKGALNDPGSRLGTIYENYKKLFPAIEQMPKDEKMNKVEEENGFKTDLNGVD